ncbi:Excreted virulence factor EspC, type VII ESX diderm [Amycolatopsis xylanica]|uniref:Excreted virulence factor EspC, type VII ESX diderm n=1 Tax=Amycolatopsis xylanica TaxID=589385 RepID=A0A1H2TAZ6_9PSEU|nr:type VII secretion target [Amycolatopsis xylanica]SDW40865.1 Excreted virulence factor EspC, type VII ESX diderm [Amycolatopsis xylanica]
MSTPGFEVDAAQIRAHAANVGALADQLSAVSQGLPDRLGPQALGGFVQPLTAGLGDAMARTVAALAHASSTVDDMSTGLVHAADGYDRADETNTMRWEDFR